MDDIRALIFDFDGLIVNTEPIHMATFKEVLNKELKIDYSEAEYREEYLGLNDRDFLDKILEKHGIQVDNDSKKKLIDKKARRAFKKLEENIPLIPGVKEFIEKIHKICPLAICSGGLKREIHFILEKLGWLDFFNPIITANEVKWGKPHPQGYLMAYEGLSERQNWRPILQPRQCLAIEDSHKGIEAAHAAGIPCVAITNSYSEAELVKADKTASSLEEMLSLVNLK